MKRLALLRELVPKAVRIAVLVNPANVPATESTLRDSRTPPVQWDCKFRFSTPAPGARSRTAFASLVRDRADALYVAGDVFFTSRRVQFATLAASYRIPASYPSRQAVEAGGLMAAGPIKSRCIARAASTLANAQGCRAGRPARVAVDQIRIGHQSEDRQGARPRPCHQSLLARADEVIE